MSCCLSLRCCVTDRFGMSLPPSQKRSTLIPVLKGDGLDAANPVNYRPIANVSFLSKIIEKIVAGQLTAYLDRNNLLPPCQSGFRKFHSTETLLLRLLSAPSASNSGSLSFIWRSSNSCALFHHNSPGLLPIPLLWFAFCSPGQPKPCSSLCGASYRANTQIWSCVKLHAGGPSLAPNPEAYAIQGRLLGVAMSIGPRSDLPNRPLSPFMGFLE